MHSCCRSMKRLHLSAIIMCWLFTVSWEIRNSQYGSSLAVKPACQMLPNFQKLNVYSKLAWASACWIFFMSWFECCMLNASSVLQRKLSGCYSHCHRCCCNQCDSELSLHCALALPLFSSKLQLFWLSPHHCSCATSHRALCPQGAAYLVPKGQDFCVPRHRSIHRVIEWQFRDYTVMPVLIGGRICAHMLGECTIV